MDVGYAVDKLDGHGHAVSEGPALLLQCLLQTVAAQFEHDAARGVQIVISSGLPQDCERGHTECNRDALTERQFPSPRMLSLSSHPS